MRCVHGTEWNFCWECRAKQAEKLIDELRHEMVPLAEAFYLRDVRGQIEVLHDQIAGLNQEIGRLKAENRHEKEDMIRALKRGRDWALYAWVEHEEADALDDLNLIEGVLDD